MNNRELDAVPGWASFMIKYYNDPIFEGLGKKFWKVCVWVNFGKFTPLFLFLSFMYYYDNFTVGAWVYTALHGIYGYCWLIKDFGFRDHQLNRKSSIGGAAYFMGTLGIAYMTIGWLFISRHIEPSSFDLFFAICLHHLGVVTMIAADAQRHFTLKYKKGLYTGGMNRYTRNPNYLGEILLYTSYVFLADHWFAWCVLAAQSILMFIPRMYAKDRVLSRHPEWAEYKAKTGLLIPWGLLNGRALFELFSAKESSPVAEELSQP